MENNYDLIIVGGGLAGLSLSILTAKAGIKTLVIEKADYPRHKVCGEYISMESYDFLMRLGVPLDKLKLPIIDRFHLSFPNKPVVACNLVPGGFGISRYLLDHTLAELARKNGVEVHCNQRVTSVDKKNNHSIVSTQHHQTFTANVVVGTYGRMSGLEQLLQKKKQKADTRYFGVKYHIKANLPDNLIEIHTFPGGYCGISKIEDGKYCMCYLANTKGLKACNGDLTLYEQKHLTQNNYLADYLQRFERIEGPISTSQFDFAYKSTENNAVLFAGDAAGFIPPITGNGMSLAFRSADKLSKALIAYFKGESSELDLKTGYKKYGNAYLKQRIQKGIFLQNIIFLEEKHASGVLYFLTKYIPGFLKLMSKQAVGKPF